jgi:hypothetical protein
MTDDYLWDRTGSVDPEVAALERALAPLRMPEPLRAPVHPPLGPRLRPSRPRDTLGTVAAALVTAAATGALIWAWVRSTEPSEAVDLSPAITIDRATYEDAPVSVGTPLSIEGPPATPRARDHDGAPAPAPPTTERASGPIASADGSKTRITTPDPLSARTKKRGRGAASQNPPPRPAPVASLRETLSSTDVRNGIDPHKERARACGPALGALPGEKVVVKLSIEGSTGLVTSSIALGRHRGTPLGNCVADALAQAVFPPFAKGSLGVQYPITMPK